MSSDEFIGVPAGRWYETSRTASSAYWLATIAVILLCLIVLTLIEHGVITGWADLFKTGSGANGG